MTRTRLRGKTGPRNRLRAQFEEPSKSTAEGMLEQAGLTLKFERVDVGEWNERRVWFFERRDGTRVETNASTFKGERTDWRDLLRDVCAATGQPFVW